MSYILYSMDTLSAAKRVARQQKVTDRGFDNYCKTPLILAALFLAIRAAKLFWRPQFCV